MASYTEHISQAKNNLKFLQDISTELSGQYWDWNVTVCFYAGVHLVNSHIASTTDLHYRRHDEVSDTLNPFNQLSLAKVPENVFTAYCHLQNLSRRSRYLISERMSNRGEERFLTFEKHFQRALIHLDTLLEFIKSKYSENFDRINVNCGISKNISLLNFTVS